MKKSGLILIAVVVFALIIAGYMLYAPQETIEDNSQEEIAASYVDISSPEAKELIDNNPDIIIVDVSPDYENGHLPGAVGYYLGDGSLDEALQTLDKEATYLVYCRFDSASRAGAQKFIDAGFMNVYRLEDHYSGWVAHGYPIEK